MSKPIGWYVRVTTSEIQGGVYDTVLYAVGLSDPAEAEEAVKKARSRSDERYEALAGAIVADVGPQPSAGEVRLLKGAL